MEELNAHCADRGAEKPAWGKPGAPGRGPLQTGTTRVEHSIPGRMFQRT